MWMISRLCGKFNPFAARPSQPDLLVLRSQSPAPVPSISGPRARSFEILGRASSLGSSFLSSLVPQVLGFLAAQLLSSSLPRLLSSPVRELLSSPTLSPLILKPLEPSAALPLSLSALSFSAPQRQYPTP